MRSIVPDLRGVGGSSVTEGPATMDLMAGDMLALLDALAIDRAVVLGASMGDYVAFSMYEQAPERFRGFIIADTRAEGDNPETVARRKKTVEGLLSEGTGLLQSRVSDLFAETTRRERPELVDEMWAIAKAESAQGLANQTLGMALRADRTALLPTITVPTLVLCGEEDTVSPPAGMQKMAAGIPGAQFHAIPGGGHLAALEQPAVFNAYVREFLLGLPA